MHTFHIPVLGLSYSVDTPLKVARYGISSVVSIIEDELIEKMRAFHAVANGKSYIPVHIGEQDHRARRITAYLNLLDALLKNQWEILTALPFDEGNDLCKYFELLPNGCAEAKLYYAMRQMPDGEERREMQQRLRQMMKPGAIDVNIMAKVDNLNYAEDGTPLPVEYSDALAALRGFANSSLHSSLVLSAGYNPRLYNYLDQFSDFYPDADGQLKKKIILKVSDYRSALIQGKLLAKKGIWISEFRIESGLNCGGHAFATDGYLLGPILQEFKDKRETLNNELLSLCNTTLVSRGLQAFIHPPDMKVTVQGGIGTHQEDEMLRRYYNLDGTGWGSPFLLVPEATNVDKYTLQQLATARKDDYYLSAASPLGVPFNNFRKSSAEVQRHMRIQKGRPGSPCYKKFLATNTEFTEQPICTASRQYQELKLAQAKGEKTGAELDAALTRILEKDCLCEGLTAAVLLKEDMPLSHKLTAVTICPGPNLAYFSGVHSLRDMVYHIYGRKNLLNNLPRPHMFVNELVLYIDYLTREIAACGGGISKKQCTYFTNFRKNLLDGIAYYNSLLPELAIEDPDMIDKLRNDLAKYNIALHELAIPEAAAVVA